MNVRFKIYRAPETHPEMTYTIVQEYYTMASVVVREDRHEFARQYFADGAGVWLAETEDMVVGCVALRRL